MNSRGAYDEDEMLRRAIEESKHAGAGSLGKRTRDDGDEYVHPDSASMQHELMRSSPKQAVKRQRTTSSSSRSDKGRSVSPGTADPFPRSKSSLRGAAARNTKEKELREKARADAAAVKAEAANRRNARSEKRRVEGPTALLIPSDPCADN